MASLEVRDGVTERLASNRWFNEQIRPKMKTAKYVVADDGFHYQLATIEGRNGESILLAKVAHTGYIKSVMSFDKELAKLIGELLQKLSS